LFSRKRGSINSGTEEEQQSLRAGTCPDGNSMPGGAAKLDGSSIPRGSDKKRLYIVAHFHEIEYKLASGFTFENDSL
jgi:hypothetical protein